MTGGDAPQRRLSVNAAFLKDIKDDNRQLKSLLEQIAALASHRQTAVNHWPELVKLFAELRDQMAFHFALEEAYGYFDEAIGAEPQLSSVAEMLRCQHGSLFSTIRDLADSAADVSPEREERVVQLLNTYKQFRTSFETHEEAELKLILQALEEDLGVGD